MQNRNLGPFFNCLVGRCGVLLPEGGTPQNLMCIVLFRDYYRNNPHKYISRSIASRRLNGSLPIPSPIWRHYTDKSGWNKTYADMCHLTNLCTGIRRLRLMQERIRSWLPDSGLPAATVAELDRYYIPTGATREQIACYLSHVRYQLMLA